MPQASCIQARFMKPVFTLAMLGLLACRGLSACQPESTPMQKSSPPARHHYHPTAGASATLKARIASLASIEAVNSPQVLAEVAGRVAA